MERGGPYGVIHRLAGDGSAKGIGTLCLTWAYQQCGHLRIDTHPDNHVMQNLLRKNGFVHCGTVYVVEDTYPGWPLRRCHPSEAPAEMGKKTYGEREKTVLHNVFCWKEIVLKPAVEVKSPRSPQCGVGRTSRMLEMPVRYITMRSKPSPKPACLQEP